ncbi:TonB-dependent receptor [Mucilaginibacter corticis]|uniref:TonB-dependent receptor n=1 Tax=Mucilaginibacter corticis TaxID=2597670 RepID=A0A556MKW8_9SPHI|nr:TonB-dependent receptor [Mucilaginibacter corticis]TSJ40522.1 TonB-dependent receptor [Mucilaginibacter corticis]
MLRKLLFIAVFVLSASVVSAQKTGRLSGKITDFKTGETLIGATILVEGTTTGAMTNVDGQYLITGLAPGKCSLLIRYMGYDTKSVSDVEIKADAVAIFNATLSPASAKSINEVIIRGSYKQESVNSLYAAQKNNIQVTDGISADIIRRSPDRNTGEVLKRVSGTSIQDGKFVVVRGLSDRYNANLLNNAILPSSEPDRKAFAFDIIPSSLVDNIVIYKTATPDLPGDFSGGTVKTTTKDLPERKFLELTVNVGYNSNTTFKNFVNPQPHGGLDFLGFDDGSRKLPDAYTNAKANYSALTDQQKIDIASKFPNTFTYHNVNSLPNAGLQLTTGNSKTLADNNRIGYIFSLNYRASQQLTTGDRTEYNAANTGTANQLVNYSFDRNSYAATKGLGGLLNLAYSYGRNKIAWRNLYNNDFTVKFEQTNNGLNFESSQTNPLRYRGFSNETSQNGLYSSVLEGTHTFSKRNIQFNWNASYGLSYRNMPDQRIVTIYTPLNQPEYVDFSNENSPKPNDLGRVYSSLHENIYGVTANLTYPFKWNNIGQQLKVGGLFSYRDRNFSTDALGYVNQTSINGSNPIALNNGVNLGNIFSPSSIVQNNLALARLDLSSTDYDGTANLNAGYLMLNNSFTDKLHLIWGARAEHYNQTLAAKGKGERDYNNTDILPSANLTYNLTAKTNLRLAYFSSLNRPEFRELADYRFFDYQTNYIIVGNPDLVRSKIANADFRFEFYPSGGEIISVSAFYKKFTNPIEQVNQGNNILSYANALSSTDYGAEMEIRKKLSFIGGQQFFRNLTFYVNASYIDAKVVLPNRTISTPLQGQSPYLINSGLYYLTTDGNLSFNLLYNRIGQRLAFRGEGNAIDIYERPRDVVDFQISKTVLNKHAELKLTLSDLFHQAYAYYYNYGSLDKTAFNSKEDKIIQQRYMGTGAVISFKYNFGTTK